MRVGIERTDGIVSCVRLIDSVGGPFEPVDRFLAHALAAGGSPKPASAYGYDLRYVFEYFAERDLDWRQFRPALAMELLGWQRRRPNRRSAQRLGPMRRRPDAALAMVAERHHPFAGGAARQLDRIEVERVFTEKASGKDTARTQLDELIAFVRAGDTVLAHSMDRLARNLDDLRRLGTDPDRQGRAGGVRQGKPDLHRRGLTDGHPAAVGEWAPSPSSSAP